jgi:hypothetical protein
MRWDESIIAAAFFRDAAANNRRPHSSDAALAIGGQINKNRKKLALHQLPIDDDSAIYNARGAKAPIASENADRVAGASK